MVAEVWPLSARPYGIALGASSNWMNNFIVGQVTPDMIEGISWGKFLSAPDAKRNVVLI